MAKKDFLYLFMVFMLLQWNSGARIISSFRQPRLSLAEGSPSYFYRSYDGNPNTYMFGYDVSDGSTNNNQYRTEERYPNGTVVGSYGYIDPNGRPQRYKYIADEKGYRVMKDRSNKNQNQQMNDMEQIQYQEPNLNQNQYDQNINQYQNEQNMNGNQQYNNIQYQPYEPNNGLSQQYQQNMYQNQQNPNQQFNQYQQANQYPLNQYQPFNQYQHNYLNQNPDQYSTGIQNDPMPSEDSITWTRPKKQKNRKAVKKVWRRVVYRPNGVEAAASSSYVPVLHRSLR